MAAIEGKLRDFTLDTATFPPGQTSSIDYEAPVLQDGSFLITEETLLAKEKRRMPTDPTTGLPFVILPIVESGDLRPDNDLVNYHHHFYNRRHPDLEGDLSLAEDVLANLNELDLQTIAGFAVRMSRGQLLPKEVHWMVHDMYKVGPVLPHTLDEKFETVVKACSGIVPRYAIDVTAPIKDRFVYMDNALFQEVANPKLLCTERVYFDRPANHRRRVIGNFLLRYAISQDLTHISSKVVTSFLSPKNELERICTGNYILKEAMRACVEPIAGRFEELHYFGMVQPGKTSVHTAIRKFIHPERTSELYPALKAQLSMVA